MIASLLCFCLFSVSEPSMSEITQAAILESTEWSFPTSTADSMNAKWQEAVLEAVSQNRCI